MNLFQQGGWTGRLSRHLCWMRDAAFFLEFWIPTCRAEERFLWKTTGLGSEIGVMKFAPNFERSSAAVGSWVWVEFCGAVGWVVMVCGGERERESHVLRYGFVALLCFVRSAAIWPFNITFNVLPAHVWGEEVVKSSIGKSLRNHRWSRVTVISLFVDLTRVLACLILLVSPPSTSLVPLPCDTSCIAV